MTNENCWSRLPRFFAHEPFKRRGILGDLGLLSQGDFEVLDGGLALEVAELMSENTIGIFSLPFSVCPNFMINGEGVMVPMVTEEPSIVAAASKMAKIVLDGGGFFAGFAPSWQSGQAQVYGFKDAQKAAAAFEEHYEAMSALLKTALKSMAARGGGLVELNRRIIETKDLGPMLLIEPLIDVVDAMGANAVNTVLEKLGQYIKDNFTAELGITILSNLADRRLAQARCEIPYASLASDGNEAAGKAIAKAMRAAHIFAEYDVYRACTHNKGIMNGVDAVAIATGNDFRALEAGAHAFAARGGGYKPLTELMMDDEKGVLSAKICLPMAVGVVGGMQKVHSGVGVAHKILQSFAKSAKSLSMVMASVGLAQCLAALYALSSEGIQRGHMKLHNRRNHGPVGLG